jgi:hypothetical protein
MSTITTKSIPSFSNPEQAMELATMQYATGERARPVVASDGKKFYVCSKATAKAREWTIEGKLFARPRKTGEQGVRAATKEQKRKDRKAKLDTIAVVNKAAE